MLKSLIQSSSSTKTQNGKVLEYLTALELCNSPDCRLWKFLDNINLKPLSSWNPNIRQMHAIEECTDTNSIYVMLDPDRGTSKVDLIFFAHEKDSDEVVRVLVQLTLSACGTDKIVQTFNCMLNHELVNPNDLYKDYRLFIGPKSRADFSVEGESFEGHRCFAFLEQSCITNCFELPIDQLCNSKTTKNSIRILAEKLGEYIYRC